MKIATKVLGYVITKLLHIVAWFMCVRNQQLYMFKIEQVANCIKIMSIAPLVVDTIIKNDATSSAIASKIALKNHEPEVRRLAKLVDSTPDINAILTEKGIHYRFYIMDKLSNYFTCKTDPSGITTVYLSRTYT
jgi:hypothetical protein